MSTANSSDNGGDYFYNSEVSLPRSVRFWLLLLFNVPSVICSFGLILHIVINRTQRYALQNHTILLILIYGLPIQLMDINFYLVFFYNGSFLPFEPNVCLLWYFNEYGFYDGGLFLLAWLAIERHILIFYDRWLVNRRRRFLYHYLPLIILVTYNLVFYVYVIFFPPCENTYDYTVPACGDSPCYQSDGFLGTWSFAVNTLGPIFVETIGSISLLARVAWQKRRLHQSNQWRKQRRMIIQLLLVSTLNISLNGPTGLIPLAHILGLPPDYAVQAELYFYFLGYFVIFLFPFASLAQFPDLRKSIKKYIYKAIPRQLHRPTTVTPIAAVVPRPRVTPIAAVVPVAGVA